MLAVLQENYITFSDNHHWQIVSWYQDAYRQIPPSMTEANQQAYQQDRSLRLAVNQNLQLKNIVIRNRFARFSEFLRYGSDILTPEDSQAVSWLAESEVEYRIRPRHLLRAGIYASLQNAEVAAYTEKVHQQRWSAMACWRFDISPVFSTVLNLRQEVQGRGKAPFTPAVGWQWRLSKQWLWKGNISRNYRLPTFNDLYWQETFAKGNPDLLPESGWAEEMTWVYHSGNEKSGWEASMTLFSLQIRDWIHWLPQGNTWQPENLSAVWSKGTEMSFKSHFFVKNIRFQGSAKYLLTQSTIIEVENQQLIQGLHKQLTYVPLHQGVTGVKVFLKNWYAEYLHQVVDKRFTNFDNSETVAAYQTGSLSIAYRLKTTAAGLTFQLGMDNIWNTRYQSIAWRPMPGRSWQLQVRADL
jgi:iron complex outermembrane receptor protein